MVVTFFFFFKLFFLFISIVAAVLLEVLGRFLETQLENMLFVPTVGLDNLFTLKISSVLSIIISKTRDKGSFNWFDKYH